MEICSFSQVLLIIAKKGDDDGLIVLWQVNIV